MTSNESTCVDPMSDILDDFEDKLCGVLLDARTDQDSLISKIKSLMTLPFPLPKYYFQMKPKYLLEVRLECPSLFSKDKRDRHNGTGRIVKVYGWVEGIGNLLSFATIALLAKKNASTTGIIDDNN